MVFFDFLRFFCTFPAGLVTFRSPESSGDCIHFTVRSFPPCTTLFKLLCNEVESNLKKYVYSSFLFLAPKFLLSIFKLFPSTLYLDCLNTVLCKSRLRPFLPKMSNCSCMARQNLTFVLFTGQDCHFKYEVHFLLFQYSMTPL